MGKTQGELARPKRGEGVRERWHIALKNDILRVGMQKKGVKVGQTAGNG